MCVYIYIYTYNCSLFTMDEPVATTRQHVVQTSRPQIRSQLFRWCGFTPSTYTRTHTRVYIFISLFLYLLLVHLLIHLFSYSFICLFMFYLIIHLFIHSFIYLFFIHIHTYVNNTFVIITNPTVLSFMNQRSVWCILVPHCLNLGQLLSGRGTA